MPPDRPTLHLTNWSSRRLHGPGRKYTIMAAPRRWEHGEGAVTALVPPPSLLRDFQAGFVTVEQYRSAMEQLLTLFSGPPSVLSPGVLIATRGPATLTVEDGDSLLCACSRDEAAAGRCHRTWAAPFLVRAGWRVVLDGVEVSDGN